MDVTTPSAVLARNVRDARKARGWSTAQLAARVAELGVPGLPRDVLANLENGRRERVSVDEWLGLALALDIAPVHLLLGLDNGLDYPVTSSRTEPADTVRDWVRGRDLLPGVDERRFVVQVPDDEWISARPGFARQASRQQERSDGAQ